MWRIDERCGAADPELLEIVSLVEARSDFFDRDKPITLARAPARLDVMGGFADYSGSLVLELPLLAATWAAVQTCAAPTFTFLSTAADELVAERIVAIALNELAPSERPLDYPSARALLTADAERAWSAYVAGAVVMLHHTYGRIFREGLKCLVHSTVPMGKGVGSSAALEVSTMQALAAHAGVAMGGRDLALLAQQVENVVVGAPCGVMDQMTSACGRRDHLLALLCQPAELQSQVLLPRELELWGLDSGIRHTVSGADYTSVRVAAFMGYSIVAGEAGIDGAFGGYLANVGPLAWESRFRDRVPETLGGRAFLDRHKELADRVTSVDPEKTYAVRACTAHPIYEHDRAQRFRALLEKGAKSEASRAELGDLMYQSHESFGACGLGSDGTDRLAELVRAAGEGSGLYGAKTTGGGSGGTVAVLARNGSRPVLDRIVAQYARETGRRAAIVGGSTDGALAYGVRKLLPR